MRVRLNSPGVLTSYNPEDMSGVVVVTVIDEDSLIVEIDASVQGTHVASTDTPMPGEQWTLIPTLSPRYIADAVVEIIGPDPRRAHTFQVKLVQSKRMIPRNASFSRTFYAKRSHLLRRT